MKNNIKNYRKRRNLSQEQIAYEMELSQHTISQWETGERIPNVIKALKLAEILETSVENLYK